MSMINGQTQANPQPQITPLAQGGGDTGQGDPDTATADTFGAFATGLAQGLSAISGPMGFAAGLMGAKDGMLGTPVGVAASALGLNSNTADPATAQTNESIGWSADVNSAAAPSGTSTDTSGSTSSSTSAGGFAGAGEGGAAAGAGGDGGGGGSSSVICTELYRLGVISHRTWKCAEVYGARLPPRVRAGYRAWAAPLVAATRRHPPLRFAVALVGALWAREMRRRVLRRGRGSLVGAAVLAAGLALSGAVGARRHQ